MVKNITNGAAGGVSGRTKRNGISKTHGADGEGRAVVAGVGCSMAASCGLCC